MNNIFILCKRGSMSSRLLSRKLHLPRTYWQGNNGPIGATHLINWGVFGDPRRRYMAKYPESNRLPTLNRELPGSKYHIAKIFEDIAPATKRRLTEPESGWIYKPFYSAKGKNIHRIDDPDECDWDHGYAQQEVFPRKYEVRVAAFGWTDPHTWGFYKKIAKNVDKSQLCWNHDQGGTFVKVTFPFDYGLFQRCAVHSAQILDVLQLDFGAIDFIVDGDGKEWFLEINLQPGFSEGYDAETYLHPFRVLVNESDEFIYKTFAGVRHVLFGAIQTSE